jgi:periplasmic protein TonB
MEQKKSKKAGLENKRGIFIQTGFVVTLSIILIGFEWTTEPGQDDVAFMVSQIEFEDEMIATRREPPKEEPKPELPKIAEVLDIVDDNVEIEDVIFIEEVDRGTRYDIRMFDNTEEKFDDDQPFITVEDMPTFNGGDPAVEFRKYIFANLVYPEIAAENGIMGKVTVKFVVNAQGRVVDAEVVRGVDPALDKEALRVVMSSPLWTPGRQRGKAVKVMFFFPISFVLQ